MKKIIGKIAIAAVVSVSGGAANADTYWGVGVSSYELEGSTDGVSISADVKGVEGSLGYEVSPNFALEGRIGVGLSDGDVKASFGGTTVTSSVKFGLDNYFSVYVRPQILMSGFQVYALLGYSSVNGEISGGGESESSDESGVSYGVGAGFVFSERNAINLEWKNLVEIDDGDITGITLSYQRRF